MRRIIQRAILFGFLGIGLVGGLPAVAAQPVSNRAVEVVPIGLTVKPEVSGTTRGGKKAVKRKAPLQAKEEAPNSGHQYKINTAKSEFLIHPSSSGFYHQLWQHLDIAILDYSGQIRFDPNAPNNSSLNLQILTSSLAVAGKMVEKDKIKVEASMHDDVLHTDQFPKITFQSTKVVARKNSDTSYDLDIWGDLDLHGVTRNFPIHAELTMEKGVLKAMGKLSLKQSEFKIKPFCATGHALRVQDEVELTFEFVAESGAQKSQPTVAKRD